MAAIALFGIAVTVVAGLLTGGLSQLIDPKGQLDAVRGEAAVRVTVDRAFQSVHAAHNILDLNTETLDQEVFVRSGGVPAHKLSLRLGLEGRRQQAVRIVNIRPEVTKRSDRYLGTLFTYYEEGGSDAEQMAVDLDDRNPQADAVSPDTGEVVGPYFAERTITLAEGEVVAATINFTTQDAYIEFDIVIEVVYGDQREEIRINDSGRPFTLTACGPTMKDYGAVYVAGVLPTFRIGAPDWIPPEDGEWILTREPCEDD